MGSDTGKAKAKSHQPPSSTSHGRMHLHSHAHTHKLFKAHFTSLTPSSGFPPTPAPQPPPSYFLLCSLSEATEQSRRVPGGHSASPEDTRPRYLRSTSFGCKTQPVNPGGTKSLGQGGRGKCQPAPGKEGRMETARLHSWCPLSLSLSPHLSPQSPRDSAKHLIHSHPGGPGSAAVL